MRCWAAFVQEDSDFLALQPALRSMVAASRVHIDAYKTLPEAVGVVLERAQNVSPLVSPGNDDPDL